LISICRHNHSFSLTLCRVYLAHILNLTAENTTVETVDDRSAAGDPNHFPVSPIFLIPATLTLKLKSEMNNHWIGVSISTFMALILIIASLIFLWIISLCKIFLLPRTPFTKHFTLNGTLLSLSIFFLFHSKIYSFYFILFSLIFILQVELFVREMSCWLLLTLMMNPCIFLTLNIVIIF